jgi:predicted dienelactone hydrolase
MKFLLVVPLLLALGTGHAAGEGKAPFHPGFCILDFPYTGPFPPGPLRKVTLTTAVWYPTGVAPARGHYETGAARVPTCVARDAQPARRGAPFPLVVLCHGGNGWGTSLAVIAEHLAAHGYVVAAPDFVDFLPPDFRTEVYFGRTRGREGRTRGVVKPFAETAKRTQGFADWCNRNHEGALTWFLLGRIRPATFVLERLLEVSAGSGTRLAGLIDPERIAVSGHSAGGVTALGLVGAHPDPAALEKRFRAALIYSAPVLHGFCGHFQKIRVPLLLLVGDNDAPALNPTARRKTIFEGLSVPRYYRVCRETTHFSFSNPSMYELDGRTLGEFRDADPGMRALCRTSLAFLDRFLKGKEEAAAVLGRCGERCLYAAWEEKEGGLREAGKEPEPRKSKAIDSTLEFAGPGLVLEALRKWTGAKQRGDTETAEREAARARFIWEKLPERAREKMRRRYPNLEKTLEKLGESGD